jgi:hypothetical protein
MWNWLGRVRTTGCTAMNIYRSLRSDNERTKEVYTREYAARGEAAEYARASGNIENLICGEKASDARANCFGTWQKGAEQGYYIPGA